MSLKEEKENEKSKKILWLNGPHEYVKPIRDGHPALFIQPKQILIEDDSFFTAAYNRTHIYKYKELKYVCGSLAFGLPPGKNINERFFQYGGQHWTKAAQFIKNDGRYDCSVWLEDLNGNVFDIVCGAWILVASVHRVRILFKGGTILSGLPYDECAKNGLLYVPTPVETQKTIFQHYQARYADELRIFGASLT